jgi:hypothetical protein
VSPRPPADGIVALRSLGRRFRGAFATREEDESPDDLAHRAGADGRSALDHVVAATRTLTFLGRALQQISIDEDAVLHPGVGDPAQRDWPEASGTVEDLVAELAREAEALADQADRLGASEWARRARVAGQDADVSAADVFWDAIDTAIAHLKQAEKTLQEVRGR